MLNAAHDDTTQHKIKVTEYPDKSCANTVAADYDHSSAAFRTMRISRKATMNYVRALSASDSEAQEYKLYLRQLSENYIHELCHEAYSHGANDDPANNIYMTQAYWDSTHGVCVKNGWSTTIGGGPNPGFKRFLGGPLDYTLHACMNVVFSGAQYQDYLKSTRSMSAACNAAPAGTQMQFNPGPNPHI